jgi:molybdopterin biosynthesis enzyme
VPYFNRSNVDGCAVAADTFGVDEESPAELSLSDERWLQVWCRM